MAAADVAIDYEAVMAVLGGLLVGAEHKLSVRLPRLRSSAGGPAGFIEETGNA